MTEKRGVRCSLGVVVFQKPPTHLALQNLLGLEFQVRSFAATSDGSGSLPKRAPTEDARDTQVETRRRAHEFHWSVNFRASPPREPPSVPQCTPPGRYMGGMPFSSGILTLDTCRPQRDEPYPCTLSSFVVTSPLPSFSPIFNTQASNCEASFCVESSHLKVAQLRVLFTGTRTQLSHFFVWDSTGHGGKRERGKEGDK